MRPLLGLALLLLAAASLTEAVRCFTGDTADRKWIFDHFETGECETSCTRRFIWRPFGSNSYKLDCNDKWFPCWAPGNYCCYDNLCNHV